MLERFTEAARQVIAVASDAARDSGSADVAPVHLLAGLAADVGPVGRALEEAGVTGAEVEAAAGGGSAAGTAAGGSRRMGFTAGATRVIEGSLRLSRQRGAARIDAHDLLRSLLVQADADVAAALALADANPEDVSRALAPPEG